MPNTTPISRGRGLCAAPGCQNSRRSSVSPLCTGHHSRARVHGAHDQTLVTRQELKPLEARVRKVIATGRADLIESSLEEINKRLLGYAESEIARFHRGIAMNRHLITACDQIEKVCREVQPLTTAVTITAMFLLQAENPRRFPQDAGFKGQLVRQFRLPAGVARGWSYNDKTGKMSGWFKPLTKEATATIGNLVVTAYTSWIVHIRQAEQRLREEETKIERSLALAFTPQN